MSMAGRKSGANRLKRRLLFQRQALDHAGTFFDLENSFRFQKLISKIDFPQSHFPISSVDARTLFLRLFLNLEIPLTSLSQ
jgi:hypothetical protein